MKPQRSGKYTSGDFQSVLGSERLARQSSLLGALDFLNTANVHHVFRNEGERTFDSMDFFRLKLGYILKLRRAQVCCDMTFSSRVRYIFFWNFDILENSNMNAPVKKKNL